MSAEQVTLFTDEDVDPRLAPVLRERGYDVISCHETGRHNRRIPDEEQLLYATLQGRTILTFNSRHFIALDRAWQAAERQHRGIVTAAQVRVFGELLRRVELHLQTCDPAVQHNCLLWLT